MLKREYLNALFLSSSHLLYDFFFLFSPNICLHIDPLFESQFFWNSAAASSKLALKQPTIRVVAIIAEGVTESDTKELISYVRLLLGQQQLVGFKLECSRLVTLLEQLTTLYNANCTGMNLLDLSPNIKMIIVLRELGGRDEYSLVEALKSGKINKPVCAWVSGTCEHLFKSEVQFGHAGAKSGAEQWKSVTLFEA
ncbi:hypothetical protein L2E82_46921 [Cichorium intybus]|uniref:Uncharacterized protein n=1 Tax=Cichorium intybus TaxID=13427 RepID=A0ACB8YY79_CICIN|nr:hypothetical protein L2E82_46921 [Cichorium intybus]